MDIYAFSNAELVSMLGRRFKDYRIRCRLTQKELAEITGVSVPTIRNFENGKSYNVSLHMSIYSLIVKIFNHYIFMPPSTLIT